MTTPPGKTAQAPAGRTAHAVPKTAHPARIDPRIRQRRVEVRREEGRRRLRFMVVSLAVAGVLAAAAGLTRSPVLDVDYVDVRGAEQTPRRQLVAATGLDGRPLMVEVDTGAVARRAEALPWVKTATARRQWPATVRIEISERAPAAVLPLDGGRRWAVADETGRILTVDAVRPPGLPAIGNIAEVGGPGSSVAEEAAPQLLIAASLPAFLRPRVTDMAITPGGEVELKLAEPSAVVRLGRPDGLGLKFSALGTVLEKADLGSVQVIDVRVPRAPVLTRR